jgi:hypothetical protein
VLVLFLVCAGASLAVIASGVALHADFLVQLHLLLLPVP